MNTFEPTISWLKSVLVDIGQPEIANRVGGCWKNIGELYRSLSDDEKTSVEPVAGVLAEHGEGWACYRYLRFVGHNDAVLSALIERGDGWACYCYLSDIGHNDAVLAALIERGNGSACYSYLRFVGHNDAVFAAYERKTGKKFKR